MAKTNNKTTANAVATGMMCADYKETSIVVYGNTQEYAKELKSIKGHCFNYALNKSYIGEGVGSFIGWCFPKSMEKAVRRLIAQGHDFVPTEDEKYMERKGNKAAAKPKVQKRNMKLTDEEREAVKALREAKKNKK